MLLIRGYRHPKHRGWPFVYGGSSLGLTLGGTATPIDLDASDWRTRAVANGGTVSDNTFLAVNTFCINAKAQGVWSYIGRLNLHCGNQLAACAVPLIVGLGGATDTMTNFVSGDYTEATGITGNGTTKQIDIGASINTILGGVLTGGIGVYIRVGLSTAGTRIPIGSSDGTNIYQIRQNTGPTTVSTWGGNNLSTSTAEALGLGWHHIDRSGPTLLTRYYAGAVKGTSATSTTPAANGQNLFVFASNVSGSASARVVGPMAGYGVFRTMGDANAALLNNLIQAFNTSLGRNV